MSGLDPVGRRQVRDLIASLPAQGKTVFMCSHILSDIEVLCDRAAILKHGRLAQVGSLEDLRQRESSRIEVMATGAIAESLSSKLSPTLNASVTSTASGLRIEIPDEKDVDGVLAALRQTGGKLVSVQPVLQSLEELFMDEE